ncbi:MAG: F0F1 ATP synthase subunit A [Bacteroidales bacterium]|nr:F0F1 ATP synthase subunit A [Bacteroidales bacterium]MDT8373633.1 F0F1 ATP synthase subunit A [Bacteroidales bacterium]
MLGLTVGTAESASSDTGKDETESNENGGKFDASTFIMDHVADSHEWHILTKKDGSNVAIYLPVIIYDKNSGLHIFSSEKLAHGHSYMGYAIAHEGKYAGKIVRVSRDGYHDGSKPPLDLSITKAVFGMMVASIILLLIMLGLARSYKRSGISAPKGFQGFLEPIILFVRDDIAIPNIGENKYSRFMPYLLTVFFFILINNLLGLIPFFPFGANVTGNVNVTFVLAFITFLITQFSGNRSHWRHVFAAPGVPFWLLPIMIPIEIIGLFSKPFALMIRLFANITAGHIIVLSLVALIFIFESVFIAPISIFFVLFMDCIELLVAFLQAYVFTLLSALFIGMATAEPEHH